MAAGRVTLWAANGLTVTAYREDDDLVFYGQDLRAGEIFGDGVSEYEYALRVHASDVPVVLAALGAPPGSDVLDVLAQDGAQVVTAGEKTWLARIGVEPQFWSRHG